MKKINGVYLVVIIISFTIFISPFILYFLTFNGSISNNDQTWSNFGSYIGGIISSIFSYISFVLILYSLFKERENVRNNETDNLFFKYYDMLNICRNNIHLHFGMLNKHGAEVISEFNGITAGFSINQKLNEMFNKPVKQKHEKELIFNECTKYTIYKNAILPFIELLQIILEFIHIQEKTNKIKYYKIIISQLTEQEKMAYCFIRSNNLHDDEKNLLFKDTLDISGIINMASQVNKYLDYQKNNLGPF